MDHKRLQTGCGKVSSLFILVLAIESYALLLRNEVLTVLTHDEGHDLLSHTFPLWAVNTSSGKQRTRGSCDSLIAQNEQHPFTSSIEQTSRFDHSPCNHPAIHDDSLMLSARSSHHHHDCPSIDVSEARPFASSRYIIFL